MNVLSLEKKVGNIVAKGEFARFLGNFYFCHNVFKSRLLDIHVRQSASTCAQG